MEVSYYNGSTDIKGVVANYITILENIRSGKWKQNIDTLLSSSTDGREAEYAELKKSLPAVTFAGTFSERYDDKIISATGIIVLDIDDLSESQIKLYRMSFVSDNNIHAFFVSPSGKGMKIIVKYTDSMNFRVLSPQVEEFKKKFLMLFLALEKYFLETYAINIDPSGKNVSRLCYISYDPNLYINTQSDVFTYPENYVEAPKTTNSFDERPERFKGYVLSKDAKYAFTVCEQWTQRHHQFEQGDRNNYVHVLSCNMNRAGIDFNDAILMVYNNYSELSFKELEQTVSSAYKRSSEFNTIDIYHTENENLPEHNEEYTEGMTTEEETVYNDTTELLNSGVDLKVIGKLIKTFATVRLSMTEEKCSEVMNKAVVDSQDGTGETLLYKSAEDTIMELMDNFSSVGGVSTLIPEFDVVMKGGFMPGQLYGFVGDGGTKKSLYAQYIGCETAKNNDGIVLYLNGEMSGMQLMDRVLNKELKIEFLDSISNGTLKKEDIPGLMEELNVILHNNFVIVNGKGWTSEMIIMTINDIEKKTKKKVVLVIADGITQMDDVKKNEILSAIHNSGELKAIALQCNVAVIALVHVSGGLPKYVRDTSTSVRGGAKMVNNMDAVFCTSLCVDGANSKIDNVTYLNNLFYIRLIDKRGSGEVVNTIASIVRPMELIVTDYEPNRMDIKLEE